MNTNINTDNYEAHLLEYLEGNLDPDEAEHLKAFVAAQGLDWNELTEELPHLEAPQIEFENKERLKKKGTLVPLYVKIASVAAAAGLLLTVTLWPEKQLPKVEPIAELKPILPEPLITANEVKPLPPKTTQFKQPYNTTKVRTAITKPTVQAREKTPLLATLEPIKAQVLPELSNTDKPNFELLAYRMSTEFAPIPFNENDLAESFDNEQNLSLIGRGIYRLTNGKHESFASLISSGLSTAKKEVSLAATDMALTAYYRTDERFEKARERWEEKREE